MILCECGQRLKVPAGQTDKAYRCPSCGETAVVPMRDGPGPEGDDPGPTAERSSRKTLGIVAAVVLILGASAAVGWKVLQQQRHRAEQAAFSDEVDKLVAEADQLIAKEDYARARETFKAAQAKTSRLDNMDEGVAARIRYGADGLVPHQGRWISVAEREGLKRARFVAAQKRKGLVEVDGQWVKPGQQPASPGRKPPASAAKPPDDAGQASGKRIEARRIASTRPAHGAGDGDDAAVEGQDEELATQRKHRPLEAAVLARTSMLTARKQVKDLPEFDPESRAYRQRLRKVTKNKPRAGSLDDVIRRALEAEQKASASLGGGGHSRAREAFSVAERLYRRAAGMQSRRDDVLAAKEFAHQAFTKANESFQGRERPASFTRGKKALAEADEALEKQRREKAGELYTQAAEFIAQAQGEADVLNALHQARQAWNDAAKAADEAMLASHVAGKWRSAQDRAKQADEKALMGRPKEAAELFNEAIALLDKALAEAKTHANMAEANQSVSKAERALANKNKFAAEVAVADVRKLAPMHEKLPELRRKANIIPWPDKAVIDIGEGLKIELVRVPAGSFTMGWDKGDALEKPAHKVTIAHPFYLGKCEVTNEQWRAVTGDEVAAARDAKRPVVKISWVNCQEFLRKLRNKAPGGLRCRLPTEAEWEYACRAGGTARFCFGDDEASLEKYGWLVDNAESRTHPVGQKKPNKFGLHDMHGNVWEWCRDVKHDDYKGAPADGSARTDGGADAPRAWRGGSYNDSASQCRSTIRTGRHPKDRSPVCGFRVAASPRE